MPHRQYIHRPTVIKDLIILFIVNLILFALFTQIDVLEWLYQLSREYETYELDELFSVAMTISLSLLIFSYRRIKELGLLAHTLEQMSLIDPLTGLPNRRAGQISLISWCHLAQRKGQTFTVYQLDLDNFKQVNDTYGQIVGDEALKLVAQLINNKIPDSAMLCRWLDDNFLVVVKNEPNINPHEFALQLQETVSGKVMSNTLNVTVSIGYKIWQSGQKVEDILHETEDALMDAKHAGGNKIKAH